MAFQKLLSFISRCIHAPNQPAVNQNRIDNGGQKEVRCIQQRQYDRIWNEAAVFRQIDLEFAKRQIDTIENNCYRESRDWQENGFGRIDVQQPFEL